MAFTTTDERGQSAVESPLNLKRVARSVLDTAWSIRPQHHRNRIIYYHSVHPSLSRSHKPEEFDRQMRWLKSEGYLSVTVAEIPTLLASPIDQPWVSVTFDDGYLDNLDIALPILRSNGMRATVFMVAAMMGNSESLPSERGHKLYPERQMLTASQLRRLHEAGIEIGSHGYHHVMASQAADESAFTFVTDASKSKHVLEEAIGNPVTSFAYPNGQKGAFSKTTRHELAGAGFETVATTLWGSVRRSSDAHELPRCEMSVDDTFDEFVAKMIGRRDYRGIYQRLSDRSRVW